ncbi:LysR family transcriptional regulator [Sinorhizobium meliloti]|uniref:LysR family transcriptional regulator n=1 Tax=Rhizobium meliloti TaxID=382 RepID=UPI000B49F4E2|nr:LysR family transcriptional regulator [Sinorhizobium meliloti]ASP74695.1 LysR family transcriptional regulator [Sinorhizobium meliloti]MDE3857810.1 LysR family transcriptional regulator [Sinorhizobium meliloti]MDW9374218.1 LysR family transcriptional regulator [Sinorhizobium meliloti]MDW9492453.1 LysR family transcriptional regulator [Sinorhizobium meliloti]MDW9560937.1 LysR family transcriptional regulator [Sinorhizobium meliloti]
MTVSMEQLEAFVAAAEHGSFSAAGRALRKAQSAVSTQVSNLEEDLGLELFSRQGRNPTLTAAGERLLSEARLILDRREHLIGVAASFEAHVEKRLVVAIDELYPEHALGELFAEFAVHFPHVELELLFPMMEDVSRLVLDGKADLGVMWRQEDLPAELGFHTIGWVQLKLVCGRNHPLANAVVGWEDLKRHRQIMVTVRTEGMERHRLRVAAEVWWVESHWVILQILKQGIGWALIPAHILARSPVAQDLAIPTLQFDDGAHPVALELVWHKQRPTGPAATWLRKRFATTKIDMVAE